ncbi:hypothetical protein ACJZ2D_012448 [Fusarium nematophilum]
MKTIVVLGASMAATPVIRQTMRNIVLENSGYSLLVVAPNTHLHWPIAMLRVIVPGQMPEGKAMIPLEAQLKQYPTDKFEHILGHASNLDVNGNAVTAGKIELERMKVKLIPNTSVSKITPIGNGSESSLELTSVDGADGQLEVA